MIVGLYDPIITVTTAEELIDLLKVVKYGHIFDNFNFNSCSLKEKLQEFILVTKNVKKNHLARTLMRFLNINETSNLSVSFWTKRGYTEEEAKIIISNRQKENSNKLKLKKEQHPEKYKDVQTTQIGYWIKKGLTEEQAKEKLKERQAVGSLENFKKRYGEKEGQIKWEERQKKWIKTLYSHSQEEIDDMNRRKGTSLENQINKYGKEEGTKKYYELVANKKDYLSKNWFVNRYGKKIGNEKYKSHREKIKGIFSKNWFIKKYGEDEGIKRWKEKNIKCCSSNERTYSIVSKKMFDQIVLLMNISKENIFYAENEQPLYLEEKDSNELNKIFIRPDFLLNNKIIEFFGDMWHANPEIFNEKDCPIPFNKNITSKTIRENDKKRIEILEKMGYKVLIIWEKDYNDDKIETVKKCVQFLLET